MIRPNQRGFTLIELVVVIVILGILAAFAVPRFMGLETQARVAAVKAIAGSMESADSMAHGVWEATASPASPLTINGAAVTFTNTYPAVASIGSLLDPNTTNGYTVPAAGEYSPNGVTTPATCNARYAAATTSGAAPNLQIVPPVVTVTVTNCN